MSKRRTRTATGSKQATAHDSGAGVGLYWGGGGRYGKRYPDSYDATNKTDEAPKHTDAAEHPNDQNMED